MTSSSTSPPPPLSSASASSTASDIDLYLRTLTSTSFDDSMISRQSMSSTMSILLSLLSLSHSLHSFPIIHIGGTKGKGSTAAFVESLSLSHGLRTALFTSPHLIHIEERFRHNGKMLDSVVFSSHFWWIVNTLNGWRERGKLPNGNQMPTFFRLLCLVMLSIFTPLPINLSSQTLESPPPSPSSPSSSSPFPSPRPPPLPLVDILILEVGIGGRLDSTNIFHPPHLITTGITSIGYDHMEILGETLGKIAGEKSGIMRRGVKCFTIKQKEEAEQSIIHHAKQEGSRLKIIDKSNYLDNKKHILGLQGVHQYENATLAVEIFREFWRIREKRKKRVESSGKDYSNHLIDKNNFSITSHDDHYDIDHDDDYSDDGKEFPLDENKVRAGLLNVYWPGRCQIVNDKENSNILYFIDGAHTDESMEIATKWYENSIHQMDKGESHDKNINDDNNNENNNNDRHVNILFFSCSSNRNPVDLLLPVASSSITFHSFISCPFDYEKPPLISNENKRNGTDNNNDKSEVIDKSDRNILGNVRIDDVTVGDERIVDIVKNSTNPSAALSFHSHYIQMIKDREKSEADINQKNPNDKNINKKITPFQYLLGDIWMGLRLMKGNPNNKVGGTVGAKSPGNAFPVSPVSPSSLSSSFPSFPTFSSPFPPTHFFPSVSSSLSHISSVSKTYPKHQFRVFVCGSLYLVGNVLKAIKYKM